MSEAGSNQTGAAFAHRLRPMSGRDPYETHRVATPLELLFDLTFVMLLVRTWDAFYAIDVVMCLLVLGAAIGLAAAGISTAVCLLVVTAAPGTIVVSFELFGHRHLAEVMARSLSALGGRD